MNKFLTYCFHPDTSTDIWEEAIAKAVDKDMPLATLRELCSPQKRIDMYLAIKAGTYDIDTPHAAQIPKNEYDEDGNMKYRTVYVNRPEHRVLLTVCNNAAFRLFPKWVHPTCTSYQKGLSCGKTVIEMSHAIATVPEASASGQEYGWKSDLSKYFDKVPRQYIDQVLDRMERELGGQDALIDMLRRYYHTDAYYTDHTHTQLVHEYRSLKQGCAFASFLADVILYDLDEAVSSLDVHYCRYSDDQLCIGPEAAKGFEVMTRMLGAMQMCINEKKLEHLTPRKAFKFLGFTIRGRERSLSLTAIEAINTEVAECLKGRKHRDGKWHYLSGKQVRNRLLRYLYNPRGEFSWAQRILRVINNQHDIAIIDEYLIDTIRAAHTGKRKIGKLQYDPQCKAGMILRTRGRNVTANRHKLPDYMQDWRTLHCMQNALHTSRAAYEALLSELIVPFPTSKTEDTSPAATVPAASAVGNLDTVLADLTDRYELFKHSIPQSGDDHRRDIFQALPYDRLSRTDLSFGMSRSDARHELLTALKQYRKDGTLTWDDTRPDMQPTMWFWKSPDRDFVLLRSQFATVPEASASGNH